MAKMKPQAILQQSKKKKGASPISITNIIIYTLALRPLLCLQTLDPEAAALKTTNLPRFATLDTGKGSVTIELYTDTAPNVVHQFIQLREDGYFKGLLFSRVVKHSVIQAGHSAEFDSIKDWNLDTSLKQEEFMVATPKAKNEQGGFELFIVSGETIDSVRSSCKGTRRGTGG